MASLLYADSYEINEHISIRIPSVGEIIDNEDLYYDVVCSIIATPYEMMVQLDDQGIDFTQISCFELFLLLFSQIQLYDTGLVFGDLDLTKFVVAENQENGQTVLYNPDDGTVIDSAIHDQICRFLRKMLCMPKNDKMPGNEDGKKYMIRRARQRLQRHKKKKKTSQLERLIIALVNSSDFPYDYDTVRDISIYQFYASLKQITHRIRFDNTMIGCYAGTVKFDELDQEEKTWIQIE